MQHDRALTQAGMARNFGFGRSSIECGRKAVFLPLIEVIALGSEISLSELVQGL